MSNIKCRSSSFNSEGHLWASEVFLVPHFPTVRFLVIDGNDNYNM